MQRVFPIVLVPQPEGGFFVDCPSLPGCYSQGETFEESLSNIREAIELTLEDLAEAGETPPEMSAPIITEIRVAV